MKNGYPYYIAADGSAYGVREVPLRCNKFTHWLLVEDVFQYEMRDDEVVEKDKVEVFGKVVTMKLIRKDGRVYPDIREFCAAVGLEIDNKGRMPVVKK